MARGRKNNRNGSDPSFAVELFLASDKLHKYDYQPDFQGAAIQTGAATGRSFVGGIGVGGGMKKTGSTLKTVLETILDWSQARDPLAARREERQGMG